MDILKNTVEEPGYMDPVVLYIPIQPSADYYYIADEDFLKINDAILYVRENPTATENTSDETTEATTAAE
jgi:hypothetical protein